MQTMRGKPPQERPQQETMRRVQPRRQHGSTMNEYTHSKRPPGGKPQSPTMAA